MKKRIKMPIILNIILIGFPILNLKIGYQVLRNPLLFPVFQSDMRWASGICPGGFQSTISLDAKAAKQ